MRPTRAIAPALLTGLLLQLPGFASENGPNIVVILADDFGVGDIQAHYPDNKIETPHLDRLVRQGMSFTNAHSPSAVCTPSRYGLLTGRYCWRTRLQEWVLACYEPPLIASTRLTLPGFLKEHGYHTACVGKWHLGMDWAGPQPCRMDERPHAQKDAPRDFTKPMTGGPTDRGFDAYFGTHVPNFPPFTFIEDDRVVTLPTARYVHDPAEGVVMPRSFAGAPMAPGWRFDRILPAITERAVQTIHDRAKQENPFFLYFSLTSPHEPVVPSERFRGASGIAPIADFVMETDWAAGQVIEAIDEAGIADDTIVLFTADNGHSGYTGWEALVAAGHAPSGPYRGHKADVWEGGHRVPFVVRWPGRVPAGHSSDQPLTLTDVFATCAELLGDALPAEAAEDSFSFLAAALGERDAPAATARTGLVSHSNKGEFAYQAPPWKLVYRTAVPSLPKSRGKPTVAELYNLEDDVAERRDLASERPEVVRRLTAILQDVITRGRSRPGPPQSNDASVRFDISQQTRWAPLPDSGK